MSDLPQQRDAVGRVRHGDEQAGELTRRTVLVGVAATTVAATVVVIDAPANARSVDASSQRDMVLFILLSAALTGISETKLATGFHPKDKRLKPDELAAFIKQLKPSELSEMNPGSDPVDIKRDYFTWVQDHAAPALEYLLQITESSVGAPDRAQAIIDRLNFKDDDKTKLQVDIDAKYLARSIALMWLLGAWYEPSDVQAASKNQTGLQKFTVISPKAYTQGWALRVAQAHPMGFSQMQFGYWNVKPNDLADFVS
jgi:hypothetical protein